jgi:hypothetical protein
VRGVRYSKDETKLRAIAKTQKKKQSIMYGIENMKANRKPVPCVGIGMSSGGYCCEGKRSKG